MNSQDLIEHYRSKGKYYTDRAEEHRANLRTYADRASQGAQEQQFLLGTNHGRASVYYEMAQKLEESL